MSAHRSVRRRVRSIVMTVVGLLLLMSIPSESHAQVNEDVRRAAMKDFHGEDMTGKDGPLAKAGLDLLTLYHAHRRASGEGESEGRRFEANRADGAEGGMSDRFPGMNVQDGRVTLDAVANGDVEALKEDLAGLGMTRVSTAGPMVSGRFPIENVPELARLETLRSVQVAQAVTRSATAGGTSSTPSETGAQRDTGGAAAQEDPGPAQDPGQNAERAPEVEEAPEVDAAPDVATDESTSSPDAASDVDAAPSRSPAVVSASTGDGTASKGASGGLALIVIVTLLVLFLDV